MTNGFSKVMIKLTFGQEKGWTKIQVGDNHLYPLRREMYNDCSTAVGKIVWKKANSNPMYIVMIWTKNGIHF